VAAPASYATRGNTTPLSRRANTSLSLTQRRTDSRASGALNRKNRRGTTMISIEKKMVAAIAVLLLLAALLLGEAKRSIESQGGLKTMIINTGKEVKDIKNQIEAE
jgi:hypothetical protein